MTDAKIPPEFEARTRETGNLAACGTCASDDDRVYLSFGCDVHGDLAEWLAANTDPKIVAKVAEAASGHEHAAAAWGEITTAVADMFDGMARRLRGDRDDR